MINATRASSIALATALLAVAACGGTTSPGATEPGPAADPQPEAVAPLAIGSSGFAGLDWGDSIEAVLADYPKGQAHGDEVQLATAHGGRDAEVSFMFSAGSLVAISVSYPGRFESMPACGEILHQVRGELDKTLGGSAEENLAVFWSSDSFSATLSCDPEGDGEEGALSMTYSLPEPEEM